MREAGVLIVTVLPPLGTGVPFTYERFPVTVGRDDTCDITISDPRVSRVHGRIDIDDNRAITFVDLGSSNGSIIDGHRVVGSRVLIGTHELRVGRATMAIDLGGVVEPPTIIDGAYGPGQDADHTALSSAPAPAPAGTPTPQVESRVKDPALALSVILAVVLVGFGLYMSIRSDDAGARTSDVTATAGEPSNSVSSPETTTTIDPPATTTIDRPATTTIDPPTTPTESTVPRELPPFTGTIIESEFLGSQDGLGLNSTADLLFTIELSHKGNDPLYSRCVLTITDTDGLLARSQDFTFHADVAVDSDRAVRFRYEASAAPVLILSTRVEWTESLDCTGQEDRPERQIASADPTLAAALGTGNVTDTVDNVTFVNATVEVPITVTNNTSQPMVPRCTVAIIPPLGFGQRSTTMVTSDVRLGPGESIELTATLTEAAVRETADNDFTYDAELSCRGMDAS